MKSAQQKKKNLNSTLQWFFCYNIIYVQVV